MKMSLFSAVAAAALITVSAHAQMADSSAMSAAPAASMTPSAATAPVVSPDGSLYKTFGGHDGLVSLMNDTMDNLVADPRTHDFFVAADQAHIKAELVDQFCHIMGGGCEYTGRDMKTVHAQLGITHADFNALVEDLQKAMDKHKIPFAAQNKLLAALAPQHRDIVTAP
ncbi:group 1 truncated hemoglobin [Asticcacaulis sp. EMRT-3]|uniref:group I truncated hemoglobin n=1 Tax=Asticcacaulis sp. EMRT-3 TaxID=3040349 RepID=UPI0024AECD71|nr:group 1 truncated hemoglobin [Asticcacaulis sp. EMRT-3]MDI7775605.1 group 1 truncated hemoglobin [Asticcacaulis sp. EMRT-3]